MTASMALPAPTSALMAGAMVEPASEPMALSRLRRQYQDYVGSKRDEIAEAQEARRYYHGAQWTAEEIKVLNERRQPVITYNRIQRKVDGVVGLLERLRQDPKAYPRTPNGPEDKGAELATATLRYALDVNDWRSLSPDSAHDGAVDGIGGIGLEMMEGDRGDRDIGIERVDPDDFFYDPRSVKPDFSDARYMGVAKWADLEAAIEIAPHAEAELRNLCEGGSDIGSSDDKWDDKSFRWIDSREKRVRLVDHWYKRGGDWFYCLHVGELRLVDDISPWTDEKHHTICKYIMYSNGVDHDGDRYGFIRNLKGPQDEINHRRSIGLHKINSRRIVAEAGAVQDVDKARREAARADGYLEITPGFRFDFDDAEKAASAAANLQLLTEAKAELENFGPNPALIGQGTGVAGSSGRAIALLQQAGIAELGPFILRYRGWKLRVYRAVWAAIQRHWTAERWIRVTDDEELGDFLQVNGVDTDPATGMPVLVNALGNLDVDIILDEGPDQVNSMADAYDTLIALSQRGTPIPPDIILELSSLPNSVKKRLLQKIEEAQQPNPIQLQGAQLELADKEAGVQGKQAKAAKDSADAVKTALEAHLAAAPFTGLIAPQDYETPFMGPAGGMPQPSAPPGAMPVPL
jgi:hypothetical protein